MMLSIVVVVVAAAVVVVVVGTAEGATAETAVDCQQLVSNNCYCFAFDGCGNCYDVTVVADSGY